MSPRNFVPVGIQLTRRRRAIADIVPCGSRSISRTRLPHSFAQYAPKFGGKGRLAHAALVVGEDKDTRDEARQVVVRLIGGFVKPQPLSFMRTVFGPFSCNCPESTTAARKAFQMIRMRRHRTCHMIHATMPTKKVCDFPAVVLQEPSKNR